MVSKLYSVLVIKLCLIERKRALIGSFLKNYIDELVVA